MGYQAGILGGLGRTILALPDDLMFEVSHYVMFLVYIA